MWLGSWKRKPGEGTVSGHGGGLGGVQFAGKSGNRVGHGLQFIADAVIDGQLSRSLPVVEHEESIAPGGHVALVLNGGSDQVLHKAQHEIGGRISGELAVEVEDAARAVGGAARGIEFAELDAGHDAVVLPDPTDLFGCLPGAIGLEPIGAGVSPAGESADVEFRSAGVLALGVGIEARDAQFGSGVGDAVDVEVVDGVGVDGLAADAEIVDQGRRDGMRVAGGDSYR